MDFEESDLEESDFFESAELEPESDFDSPGDEDESPLSFAPDLPLFL